MAADLDRFDRMMQAFVRGGIAAQAAVDREVARVNRGPAALAPVVVREPVITSTRGPRFVDYMPCPMCGYHRVGIEFHGVLMSGAKVHQLYAHTHGLARVERGKPRCLGAGMRVVFEGGVWKGAQT